VSQPAPLRVIMDVDTGVDDALALALAVRHPRIQLEAVLTVAGNVSLQQTTRNTLCVLDWLGATDVPVHAGAERGLSGPFADASHWHGPDGLGNAQLPASTRQAGTDAVGYLIERLRAEPGVLSLVCTAPLTNLALALDREPTLARAARSVVLMGGVARPPGNVTPVAEFNIHADPLAAARVFEQPWPVTMVGLDVTQRAALTRAERDTLAGNPSPEAVLVHEVTRFIFEQRQLERVILHDALAVAVAIEPGLVTTIERNVAVETRGEHTLGQTVVDLRSTVQGGRGSGRTQVCMEVDVARFKTVLFSEALGLSLG
jgi:inosine-uridine nucleoside N-ribohydrolase